MAHSKYEVCISKIRYIARYIKGYIGYSKVKKWLDRNNIYYIGRKEYAKIYAKYIGVPITEWKPMLEFDNQYNYWQCRYTSEPISNAVVRVVK